METDERSLTLKEQRFVDAYLGSAAGNATQAVLSAGYTQNRGRAKTLAARLLTKVHIRAAVNARANRDTRESIATAEERDQLLSAIARDANVEPGVRVRAIAELNRCTGRHSVKHLHEAGLTLEQVLGDSRK